MCVLVCSLMQTSSPLPFGILSLEQEAAFFSHSGLRRQCRPFLGQSSVTISVGTLLGLYDIAYRRAYGLSTSGLFLAPSAFRCAADGGVTAGRVGHWGAGVRALGVRHLSHL